VLHLVLKIHLEGLKGEGREKRKTINLSEDPFQSLSILNQSSGWEGQGRKGKAGRKMNQIRNSE